MVSIRYGRASTGRCCRPRRCRTLSSTRPRLRPRRPWASSPRTAAATSCRTSRLTAATLGAARSRSSIQLQPRLQQLQHGGADGLGLGLELAPGHGQGRLDRLQYLGDIKPDSQDDFSTESSSLQDGVADDSIGPGSSPWELRKKEGHGISYWFKTESVVGYVTTIDKQSFGFPLVSPSLITAYLLVREDFTKCE